MQDQISIKYVNFEVLTIGSRCIEGGYPTACVRWGGAGPAEGPMGPAGEP